MKKVGLFKLDGLIDGYSFYKSKGEMLVRKASGFTKERIKNDPKLARVRENWQEFSGAAIIGKRLRSSVKALLREIADSNVSNRLVVPIRRIIGNGMGPRGRRPFSPMLNKGLLEGFEWNNLYHLDEVFFAPYTLEANADRNGIVLTVPVFYTSSYLTPPEGATHFRLVGACVVLSEYTYDPLMKVYEPMDEAANGKSAVGYSNYLPIGGSTGAEIWVTPGIVPSPVVAATSGLVACVGIQFFREASDGSFSRLSGGGMKVVEVF
jgi:hypothetical protein